MWRRTTLLFGLALIVVSAAPAMTGAEDGVRLAKPQGPVVLTVSGKIGNANSGQAADFDMEMLEGLGRLTLRTSTPWTDGTQVFRGVLMRDVLAAAGATGDTVRAIALNDYSYVIEVSDFLDFPVLIATDMNGDRMRVRDKGPLWIVYPRDDYAELRSKDIDYKMVWQLRELVVE
jgi:hypothetical protein